MSTNDDENLANPRYTVRLTMQAAGADPADAARHFATHALEHGLASITYVVDDNETGVRYFATLNGDYARADLVMAEMEEEDRQAEGAEEEVDEPAVQVQAEQQQQQAADTPMPIKGVCKRCGDLELLDPRTNLCRTCEEDIA